jgi:hypothetical protein
LRIGTLLVKDIECMFNPGRSSKSEKRIAESQRAYNTGCAKVEMITRAFAIVMKIQL